MNYSQGNFSTGNVLPKYVCEDTLKRSRVETASGTAIRVSNTTESPVDLTTLNQNTEDIKNHSEAISAKIGTTADDETDASVIGLLVKTGKNTEALGTTSDTSSDSTVIGLLKSIASKLQ